MATQAAVRGAQPQAGAAPKVKILRIGIIQGGRIVEERLVRKRENITIGQSAKNLFVVPSDALPRHWLLFEISGSHYVAHFSDGMDARIAVGNEIISLAQLKQTGKIQKRGSQLGAAARRAVARKDHARRHDDPVPVRHAAAAAAAAAAAGLGARLDHRRTSTGSFATIAAGSFLLHLLMVIYLRNVDWPRKPDIEEIPDRFVKMMVKKVEKPPEPKKEVAEGRREEGAREEEGRGEEGGSQEGADARGESQAGRGEGQGRRRAAGAAGRAGAVDRLAQAARRAR